MDHRMVELRLYEDGVRVLREALADYAQRREDLAREAFADGEQQAGVGLSEDADVANNLIQELS